MLVTSRVKEMATTLLDDMEIEHHAISTQSDGSVVALLRELVQRDYRLYQFVRTHRPDVMAAIGGTFISHVGRLTRTPALVFYDTENARLQNALTYPFASLVYVPECYRGRLPRQRAKRYRGYHELSYLHPRYFHPDYQLALANGLAPDGDTFLIRLVSWKANHDIGDSGWTARVLRNILEALTPRGRVLISSEEPLPDEFSQYRYSGDCRAIHHVLAYCRGYVGESATMASECAVLGVPAVYAADSSRGYTTEQEQLYNLVRNVAPDQSRALDAALAWMLQYDRGDRRNARQRLLEQSVDVAEFVTEEVEQVDRR